MIARLFRLPARTPWRCSWCGATTLARSETAAYRAHRDYCPRKDIR